MESSVTNVSYSKKFQIRTPQLGVDKCLEESRYLLQVRGFPNKLRRLITSCDVCQRVKHPKCSLTTDEVISQHDQEMDAQCIHTETYLYLREMFGISLCVMTCF